LGRLVGVRQRGGLLTYVAGPRVEAAEVAQEVAKATGAKDGVDNVEIASRLLGAAAEVGEVPPGLAQRARPPVSILAQLPIRLLAGLAGLAAAVGADGLGSLGPDAVDGLDACVNVAQVTIAGLSDARNQAGADIVDLFQDVDGPVAEERRAALLAKRLGQRRFASAQHRELVGGSEVESAQRVASRSQARPHGSQL
jgi:hypothetical protein